MRFRSVFAFRLPQDACVQGVCINYRTNRKLQALVSAGKWVPSSNLQLGDLKTHHMSLFLPLIHLACRARLPLSIAVTCYTISNLASSTRFVAP